MKCCGWYVTYFVNGAQLNSCTFRTEMLQLIPGVGTCVLESRGTVIFTFKVSYLLRTSFSSTLTLQKSTSEYFLLSSCRQGTHTKSHYKVIIKFAWRHTHAYVYTHVPYSNKKMINKSLKWPNISWFQLLPWFLVTLNWLTWFCRGGTDYDMCVCVCITKIVVVNRLVVH